MHKRLLLVLLVALSGLPLARAEQVQLMFVQTADDLKADGKTLRLVNVGQQTLYFSDRPVRLAGHMPMAAYIDEWKPSAGPDNFGANPPNATLSVYEPGQHENTLAVDRGESSGRGWEGPDIQLQADRRHGAQGRRAQPRCSSIGSA